MEWPIAKSVYLDCQVFRTLEPYLLQPTVVLKLRRSPQAAPGDAYEEHWSSSLPGSDIIDRSAPRLRRMSP